MTRVRVIPLLVLLALAFTGCVTESVANVYTADGIRVDPPWSVTLTAPSGLIVLAVSNPANVSFIGDLEGLSLEGAPVAFAAAVFFEDGTVGVPRLREHDPLQPNGSELSVGSTRLMQTRPEYSSREISARDAFFTDATTAVLALAWSGFESGSVTLHWHLGSDVEESWRGTEAMAFDSYSMEGTRAQAETYGVDFDRRIDIVAPEGTVFGAVESRSALAEGYVRVVDREGERAADLVAPAPRVRTTFTGVGDISIVTRTDDWPILIGLVADLPPNLLPRAWTSNLQSY